ncbi:MAG TPA: bifunctional DNA primase/polymerase [Kofleriaceae bacterium]
MLRAAYGYVDRCAPWPIIPLVPNNKRPAVKTGRDHAEGSTIDLSKIADWHRRGLLEAIGTATGAVSGTVVIDVDAKHDGESLLAELETALGPLPRTKVVRTRSGGLHIYCAHPGNGIRVRSAGPKGQLAKLLGDRPGVDVRGDGGLVVLPPSLGYSWITDDDEPLSPLPRLWLAAINGAGDPPRPMPSTTMPACSDDRRINRARKYLAKMSPSISGSGGHDALWAAVVAMMWGFDLHTEIVRALIASDFNPRCDPPWDEREIDHKLVGVERAEKLTRGYLLGGR